MRRKNKNIILITILLAFISFSVILYNDLTSISNTNNSYNETYDDNNYSNDYGSYFPGYNYGNDGVTTTNVTKTSRSSQIIITVVTSVLIFISIQILFYVVNHI